jgi:hypothetical protein
VYGDSCKCYAAYQSDLAVAPPVSDNRTKQQKGGRPLRQQVRSSTETNSPKTAAVGGARFDAADAIIASCRPVAITCKEKGQFYLPDLLRARIQWAHSWQQPCRSTYRPRCAASG